jgi:hypothetical protein
VADTIISLVSLLLGDELCGLVAGGVVFGVLLVVSSLPDYAKDGGGRTEVMT